MSQHGSVAMTSRSQLISLRLGRHTHLTAPAWSLLDGLLPGVCGRDQQLGPLLVVLLLLRLLLEEDVLPHLSQAQPQRLYLILQVSTPPTQSLVLRLEALQATEMSSRDRGAWH